MKFIQLLLLFLDPRPVRFVIVAGQQTFHHEAEVAVNRVMSQLITALSDCSTRELLSVARCSVPRENRL